MAFSQFLPGTGRGTATRSGVVEGQPQAVSLRGCSSVTATRCHLPAPERNSGRLRTFHFVHFRGLGASA